MRLGLLSGGEGLEGQEDRRTDGVVAAAQAADPTEAWEQ
jgi:hypothetical protein